MLWTDRENTCVLLSQQCFHLGGRSLKTCVMSDSSHECLKMSQNESHCLTMTHFCYCDLHDTKKGGCRVSKLVNNSWPATGQDLLEQKVGAHVPSTQRTRNMHNYWQVLYGMANSKCNLVTIVINSKNYVQVLQGLMDKKYNRSLPGVMA